MWLVFATWAERDLALWNSHWIAQQTLRLAEVRPSIVIERDAATREALEAALADPSLRGLALFGHGRPHAVMGSDGREALDVENVGRLDGRWAHAVACRTGASLVHAAAAHADVFVGYHQSLIVEWTIEELPEELRERIARMVTATTFALVSGVRAQPDLQRRASAAADDVVAWLLNNTEDGNLGIHILAQQLVDAMVVRGRGDDFAPPARS